MSMKKNDIFFNELCRGWYHVQDTLPSLKAWIYTSGKRAECFLSLFCEKYAIPEVGIKSESFSYRLLKIVFWHSKVIAAKAIDINTYQQNFQSWWSWWYSCTCVLFVCLFVFVFCFYNGYCRMFRQRYGTSIPLIYTRSVHMWFRFRFNFI